MSWHYSLQEKSDEFVDAWYDELSLITPTRESDYDEKRRELKAALQPDDRRRLREIAPYPIILTMMAIVHTHRSKLPDSACQGV